MTLRILAEICSKLDAAMASLQRIEQNTEKIMTADTDLQAAVAALTTEVAAVATAIQTETAALAAALAASGGVASTDVETAVTNINAQVAALQTAVAAIPPPPAASS